VRVIHRSNYRESSWPTAAVGLRRPPNACNGRGPLCCCIASALTSGSRATPLRAGPLDDGGIDDGCGSPEPISPCEFKKNSSRTIVFWSDKWGVPLDELVSFLRGKRRLTRKHHVIFRDVPFTREEYDAAEHKPRRSVPEQLQPLFKNLKVCPGCSMVMGKSKWKNHECPPERRLLLGAPNDTRGRESAGIKKNALAGDPDWPPLFFGGGLPTLGKRR
jgi:hypothetical protein